MIVFLFAFLLKIARIHFSFCAEKQLQLFNITPRGLVLMQKRKSILAYICFVFL